MKRQHEVHELNFECVKSSATSQKEWFCEEINFIMREIEIFGDGTIYAKNYPIGSKLSLTTVIKLEVPDEI